MGKMTLTGKGRRWVAGGHPWIYKDDIAEGKGEPGELLPVFDPAGKSVGWGLFSSTSRIAVRMVTRDTDQPNRAFWKASIERALAHREAYGLLDPAGACRLIAGDADGFPGWIVDRYTDVLSCSAPPKAPSACASSCSKSCGSVCPSNLAPSWTDPMWGSVSWKTSTRASNGYTEVRPG